MPFAKRCIEPVNISRQPLDPSLKFELDAVSNNALVGALRQLASLAHHAEDLFADLGEEFKFVVQRAERLKNRLDAVTETVGNLDAKTVTVPVGDLATFTQVDEHFTAHHGFDQNLFTPASRPDYLDKLYETAMASPVKHIRECNEFRKDGRTGSKLFSLVPVLSRVNLDPPPLDQDGFKKPTELIILEREAKTVPKYRRRPHSIGAATDLEFFSRTPPLPTPEDRVREMSRSQPSSLIPINITGSSFHRMCEFRQSLRSASSEFVDKGTKSKKRKRRSQTISGIPGYVQEELNKGDYHEFRVLTRSRSPGKERPKSTSVSQISNTLRGRERDKKKMRTCSNGFLSCLSSQDTPVMVKRSKSLPRSMSRCHNSVNRLSSRSASTDMWLDDVDVKPLLKQKKKSRSSLPRAHSVHGTRDISTVGKDSSQLVSLARDFKRASTDLSTASTTSSWSRAQSMEIRMPASNHKRQPIPISAPKTPSVDSVSSSSSLKPQTINGVKLRQNMCKVISEDRQSSSGNWSGSSSARQSLGSDYQRSLVSGEVSSSHDRDSALSLNIQANSDKEQSTDKPVSDSNGYGTESSTLVPDDLSTSTMNSADSNFTNMPSHLWLRNVEKERFLRLSMMDQMSSSSQDTITSVPKMTIHNLKAHECALLPYLTQTVHQEEDNTSLYSVDQEGFYTSFHVDSGVRKQNFQILDDDTLLSDNNMDRMSMGVPVFKERAVRMRRRSSNASLLLCQLPKMMRGKRPKSKKIQPPPPEDIDIKAMVSSALAGNEVNGDTPMQRFEKEPRRIGSKDDLLSSDAESRSSTLKSNASSGSRQPVYTSWYKFHEDDLESQSTVSTKSSNRSSTILHGPAHDAVTVTESDADTIYARLKRKTSISSNVYPSICSVTLDDSDEEGNVKGISKSRSSMSFSTSSLRSSLSNKSDETVRSQYLPPWFPQAEENKYATLPARFTQAETHKTLNNEDTSSTLPRQRTPSPAEEKTEDGTIENDYATWPRSPMGHKMEIKTVSILKSSTERKIGPPKPPRTLNFAPMVNMFDPEAQHIKSVLPEPLTPDDILEDRIFSCEHNSFKATTDLPQTTFTSPVQQNGASTLSIEQSSDTLTEMCAQGRSCTKTSSSTSGSMSSSASTSTESDDKPPELPSRYHHSIRVRPGDKNKATKKRRPVSLPPGVKRQHSLDKNDHGDSDAKQLKRDHIYANVVVRKPRSMPTTPVGACPQPLGGNLPPDATLVNPSPSSSSLTSADKAGISGHHDGMTAAVVYRRRGSTKSEGDADKAAKRNSHYASTDIFDLNKTPSVGTVDPIPMTTTSSEVKHYAAAMISSSNTWPGKPSVLSSPEVIYTMAQQSAGHEFITISQPKTYTVTQSTAAASMRTFAAKIDSTGVLIKTTSNDTPDLRDYGKVATIYKPTARRNSVTSGSPPQPVTVTNSFTPISDVKTNTNEDTLSPSSLDSTSQPVSASLSVFSKPVTLFLKFSTSDATVPTTVSLSTVSSYVTDSTSVMASTKINSVNSSSWYKPSIGSSPPPAFTPVTNVLFSSSNVFSSKNVTSSPSNGLPSTVNSIRSHGTDQRNMYTNPTIIAQNVKTAKISSTKDVTSPCHNGEVRPPLVATSPTYSVGHTKVLISPKNTAEQVMVSLDSSSSPAVVSSPAVMVSLDSSSSPAVADKSEMSKKFVSPSSTESKVITRPIIKAARKSGIESPEQDQTQSTLAKSSTERTSVNRFSSCYLPFSLLPTKTSHIVTTNTSATALSDTVTKKDLEKGITLKASAPVSKPTVSQNPSPAAAVVNQPRDGSTNVSPQERSTALSTQRGTMVGTLPSHTANSPVTSTQPEGKLRAASEEPSTQPSNLTSSSGLSRSMRDLFFQENSGSTEQSKAIGGSSWDRIITKSTPPTKRASVKATETHDVSKTNSFSFLKTPEAFTSRNSTLPLKVDNSSSQISNSMSSPSSTTLLNGHHVTDKVNGVTRVSSLPPPPPSVVINPKHVTSRSSAETVSQKTAPNVTTSFSQPSKPVRSSLISGGVDELAVMSILESIKTSLKVISENNNSTSSVAASKQTAV